MRKSFAGTALIAAVISLGTVASPAGAEAAAAAKQDGPETQTAAGPAKIKPGSATKYCVTEEMTGSRIGKKTCRTKAEWKAFGVEIATK